jgi:hypothetical protein
VALAEPSTSFYWTSNVDVARKSNISEDIEFEVALLRRYLGHPPAVALFSRQKRFGNAETTLAEQLESFFTAEKLPDFINYEDAREDSGRLLLSVPIPYHMYIVGPASKLSDASTIAALRAAAAELRGHVGLLTSDIAEKDESGQNTVADLFQVDENTSEIFVSYFCFLCSRLLFLIFSKMKRPPLLPPII